MMYIKAKINRFNKTFNKEEKIVIVLGSLVTMMFIVLGLIALLTIASKIFNWYIDLTAPMFMDAMNKLVGALFPGWRMF